MKYNKTNNEEQELRAALGLPKYAPDAPGLVEGTTCFWFPTRGDSMTDDTPRSIPSGSLVLGRWIKLTSVLDIPLHRPIVIIIDDNGTQYCMLKTGCKIQKECTHEVGSDSDMLCLRSYNPTPRCDDFWMPFGNIRFVFVVERVRLPDGKEFEPIPEEVIREGRGQ